MTGGALLSLDAVGHHFGGLKAVDAASFDVEPGGITSLIGPNGAGKTTVFNIITGVLRAHTGRISFAGRDIQNRPPHEIALRGVGRTFQAPRVFPEASVRDNVLVGLRLAAEAPWRALLRGPGYRREVRAARERAEEMLDSVGLLARAHEPAGRLSFGEQRFLSIARTLVSRPTLVMMDEPTVGLDDEALAKLTDLMRRLVSEGQATVLLIEHHMDVVMAISRKVVLLVQGSVVIAGTPAHVRESAVMLEAYLGQPHHA